MDFDKDPCSQTVAAFAWMAIALILVAAMLTYPERLLAWIAP